MKFTIELGGRSFTTDSRHAIDLSIPLDFEGAQPNHFGAPRASSRPYSTEGFVGDTRRGGSCTCFEYRLIPHCHGVHTETAAHLYTELDLPPYALVRPLVPLTLVSVTPTPSPFDAESYDPSPERTDLLITERVLRAALEGIEAEFLTALAIRTLPNDESKRGRNYRSDPPPYFSVEAMRYLAALPVRHLLVDIPSLDRADDEGKLSCHRIFWGAPRAGDEPPPEWIGRGRTVTEMLYASPEVEDGFYLLNLQLSPFKGDAAPSRPLLFPLREEAATRASIF